MADHWWVGGGSSTDWNATAPTNWSIIGSGGAGGATAPSAGDNVFFDANSGSGTSTLSTTFSIGTLDCTGYTGTLSSFGALTISGNTFKLGSGMTATYTGTITFTSTSGTTAITSNGKAIPCGMTFNGVGGTFQLQDALNLSGTKGLTLTNGTFTANNFNVTSGNGFSSNNGNTRTLTMGSGLWTIASWATGTTTGLTFNKNTADIVLVSTVFSSLSFDAGGLTFNNITISARPSFYGPALFVSAATFSGMTWTAPVFIQIAAGVTITATSLTAVGSSLATNHFMISTNSTGVAQATLSIASGAPTMSYGVIYGMAFTGGATFTATNSIDFGNNSGITITAPSSGSSSMAYKNLMQGNLG